MRRYTLYIAIALAAFVISLSVVAVSYYKINLKTLTVEEPLISKTKWANDQVKQAESLNKGFDELLNVKDGDFVTVQGFIDVKFLCFDVTELQPNVCSTVIGNAQGDNSAVIRLKTCGENNQSNCIVWKPGDLCDNGEPCANRIRIYDCNSKFADHLERIGKNSFISKPVKLKVTGKVSIAEGKARLSTPIEKIEFIDLP